MLKTGRDSEETYDEIFGGETKIESVYGGSVRAWRGMVPQSVFSGCSVVLLLISYHLHAFTTRYLPASKKCFGPSIVWGFTCFFTKGLSKSLDFLLALQLPIGFFLLRKFALNNALLNHTVLYPIGFSTVSMLLSYYAPPIPIGVALGMLLLQGWSLVGGLLMLMVFPATLRAAFEPQNIRDGLLLKFIRHSNRMLTNRHAIPSKNGIVLDALAVKNDASDRWVLYLGGNSELMEYSLEETSAFREVLDVNLVFYNPRGVGWSTSYVSEVGDLVDDAAAVIQFITTHYSIDHKKLLLWGHSIGGGVAAAVARKYGIQCPLLFDRTFTRLTDAAAAFSPFPPSLTRIIIKGTIGDLNVVGDCQMISNKKFLVYHRMDEVINYTAASPGHPEILSEMGVDEEMVVELRSTRVQSPHNSFLSAFEEKTELRRRINAFFSR